MVGATTRRLYSNFPHKPTIGVKAYTPHVPQSSIDDLLKRLHNSNDILTTFENSYKPDNLNLGITKVWMEETIGTWKSDYDWEKTEEEINSFPNFMTNLETRGHNIGVHFIALFSEDPDAVPLIMSHGWPGSILEFLPLLHHLTSSYTPQTLPIHLVVPSLPGFGFSGPPPRHDSFSNLDTATLFDGLMRGLGFAGYVAQGGDIGSRISRLLGEKFEGCKAVHLNAYHLHPQPPQADLEAGLDESELKLVQKALDFDKLGIGYNMEQATRPATIGVVVGSDPVALLAWIGEKLLEWPHKPLTTDQILANVSLYWLTRTFPTSLYNYRTSYSSLAEPSAIPGDLKDKPVGYSLFPYDIRPFPVKVVARGMNIVWSKVHDQGGHFAAWELPEVLWDDVSGFIKAVWKKREADR